MAIKDQERAELHKSIWQIANQLRGSVDGWDFKQYVLGMLFYRFISENITKYINDGEEVDYATLSDSQAEFGRKEIVNQKGFYILPSELFVNVVKQCKKWSKSQWNFIKSFQKYRIICKWDGKWRWYQRIVWWFECKFK
jgi:type I restriction enzyme M protein